MRILTDTLPSKQRLHPGSILLFGLLLLAGCVGDMRDQPRYEPLEQSSFFADQRSARPIPDNTVPWKEVVEADFFYTGLNDEGQPVEGFPFPVSEEVLQSGRKNYDIYCSPCHATSGYGDGMIVQRGFIAPPSLHIDRLRQAPAGYFYGVITNGFGQMYSYAYRIPPAERWAIVAYIRALQLSQNASEQDVPPDQLPALQGASQ